MKVKNAESLLQELGIEEPSEIDLEAIAEYCGAFVTSEPLTGCEARIIGTKNRATITINSSSSPYRQRFSIGHELGHWAYRHGKTGFSCKEKHFRNWSKSDPEYQANQYASELLMPSFLFSPRMEKKGLEINLIEILSKTFQTSLTATAIRIVNLSPLPCVLVFNDLKKKKTSFIRSESFPDTLYPISGIPRYSEASTLISTHEKTISDEVTASNWFSDVPNSPEYYVVESSFSPSPDQIVSLLWWQDEGKLLDLEGDPETELLCPL